MKILFERLIIKNFLSILEADVELKDRGYTLVSGVNNNPLDLAKSNGAGKSSLFEAISYALTGETIRGVKDVINMYGDDGTYVELHFSVDGKKYKIIRTKEHSLLKTDLKIYIDDKDVSGKGIRDSQKLLGDYLPDITSSLVGSVILLGQGLPQRFTNNTPAGRKDVLEKLSKSDFMIEDLKTRLNNRKFFLTSELRRYEDGILNSTAKISVLNARQEDISHRINSMPPIEEYDTEIDTLQKDISNYNSQIRNLQAVIDRITQDIDGYSNIIDSKKTYYTNKVQEEITPIQQQIDKNSEDIIPIMSRLTMLNNEIERAKNITDICPTCGQHIEGVTLPDTSQMEEEVIILSAKYKEICDINNSLKISIEEIRKNCSNQLLLELSDINSTVNDLKRKLSEYSANIRDVQAKLNTSEVRLATTLANKESYNITLANLQEDFSKCVRESEKENENIVYNNKGKQSTQERLDAINKMITVTNRDFRGFLLTNVIQFIDKQSKSYCKDIFDTDKIQFTLEGNNISIRYCDKQYETLSGGEKQKVDLIVQFAIRDMLCQFLDFRCNIIALDEIFDNLDSVGCERVVQLISKKLTDIESIFVITHHSDISIPVDSHITLVKNDKGTSYVRNN